MNCKKCKAHGFHECYCYPHSQHIEESICKPNTVTKYLKFIFHPVIIGMIGFFVLGIEQYIMISMIFMSLYLYFHE